MVCKLFAHDPQLLLYGQHLGWRTGLPSPGYEGLFDTRTQAQFHDSSHWPSRQLWVTASNHPLLNYSETHLSQATALTPPLVLRPFFSSLLKAQGTILNRIHSRYNEMVFCMQHHKTTAKSSYLTHHIANMIYTGVAGRAMWDRKKTLKIWYTLHPQNLPEVKGCTLSLRLHLFCINSSCSNITSDRN